MLTLPRYSVLTLSVLTLTAALRPVAAREPHAPTAAIPPAIIAGSTPAPENSRLNIVPTTTPAPTSPVSDEVSTNTPPMTIIAGSLRTAVAVPAVPQYAMIPTPVVRPVFQNTSILNDQANRPTPATGGYFYPSDTQVGRAVRTISGTTPVAAPAPVQNVISYYPVYTPFPSTYQTQIDRNSSSPDDYYRTGTLGAGLNGNPPLSR